MSKRLTDGYFALVITCLFGMSSIGVVSVGFYKLKGYQSADQEHAAYYAERHQAEVNYSECLDAAVTLNGARECINNAPSRTRDAQRAEQDLNAQREMAQWAEGMLWAAWTVGLLTFFATVVGVRYIYLTLVSTQDMAAKTESIGNKQVAASIAAVNAARDANRVAAQQFRAGFKPWITVEVGGDFINSRTAEPFNVLGEDDECTVMLVVKTQVHCIGTMPATIENFELKFREGSDWPYVSNHPVDLSGDPDSFFTIMLKGDSINVDPRQGIVKDFHLPFNDINLTRDSISYFVSNPPWLLGSITYSGPTGVQYRHNFAVAASLYASSKFERRGGAEYNNDSEVG